MKWVDLSESDHGRYCGQCRKEVFDLTGCSAEEVAELQKKHVAICGAVRTGAVVAVTAASLSLVACSKNKPDYPPAEPMVLGMICPVEQVEDPEEK